MRDKTRGFIITTDATIAVALLVIAVILLSTEWFRPLAPDGLYLKQVSLDTLEIIKKDGIAAKAINGNSSAVREVFEAMPNAVCMELTIDNARTYERVATIPRPGCEEYEKALQTIYVPVIYEGNIYVMKLESWHRKAT